MASLLTVRLDPGATYVNFDNGRIVGRGSTSSRTFRHISMRISTRLLALVMMLGIAMPAQAQFPGFSFGIGGGPALATGQLADVVDTGFHLLGTGELSIPLLPVGVRATAEFARLPGHGGVNYNQFSGTLNGKVGLPIIPVLLSPYATAGVGVYYGHFGGLGEAAFMFDRSNTVVGLNAGVGVELNLLLVSLFAEARVHNLLGASPTANVVPLTIGISF
jgi:hypothetical protein